LNAAVKLVAVVVDENEWTKSSDSGGAADLERATFEVPLRESRMRRRLLSAVSPRSRQPFHTCDDRINHVHATRF